MKSVQEILDIVIIHGYFNSHFEVHRTSPYMCIALDCAAVNGVITRSEGHMAATAILEYLRPTGRASLDSALQQSYLPNNFERRLRLYRNWADRPTLTPKVLH